MKEFSFFHSTEHSYNYVKSLFRDVCTHAATPFGTSLLRFDDTRIANASINPLDYEDPLLFQIDYSLSKYLSKWKGLKTGIDTEAAAILAFETQEKVNNFTNGRLKSASGSIVDPILHRASRTIAKLLGPFHENKLFGLEDWGPGATVDMSRSRAQVDSKILNFPIQTSSRAKPLLERAIVEDLHWSYCLLGSFPVGPYRMLNSCFEITNFSRITTVPKNSKTDRTIAIEPRGNMFLQKACGSYIRTALKKIGVNLDDQSRNQILAGECIIRVLATIDLSMASDSIVRELIWLLLPFDWANHLERIRSTHYLMGDDPIPRKFEKFSSMGNGFTFELESLIFYALVRASTEEDDSIVSIYGDDIICPQSDAAIVISTLNYCGFAVNVDKSYVEGNFFESCGRHYFKGRDVTPIYQKQPLDDEFETIRFMNRIVRMVVRNYVVDESLKGPWAQAWGSRIPRILNSYDAPMLPLGSEGDEGFLINWTLMPQKMKHRKSYGYKWPVIRQVPVKIPASDEALLALSFRRGVCTKTPYNGELDSRSVKGTRTVRSSRWIDPFWEFALD